MSTVSRRPGDDDSEKVRWWVSPSMSTASVIAWPASNGIAPVSGRKVKVLTVGVSGRIPTQTSRSEEHTSELQSLMRISYAVFCLTKKKKLKQTHTIRQ